MHSAVARSYISTLADGNPSISVRVTGLTAQLVIDRRSDSCAPCEKGLGTALTNLLP
jgi:hypothetical protein